ncbi:MAG: WG repeat-containing protein, partial [Oscillospiraceae bacterium]|nr:WG repeat-containing protein [Oscillospiraceae bacterium]
YDDIRNAYNNLVVVNKGAEPDDNGYMRGGQWGVINDNGKVVVPIEYDDLGYPNPYSGYGLFTANKGKELNENGYYSNGKWGVVDTNGKVIVPLEYEYASVVTENLITLRTFIDTDEEGNVTGGKWGLVNTKNEVLLPFEYDGQINYFNYGGGNLAQVYKNGKYGFIDKTGKLVTAVEYDAMSYTNNNFISVRKGEKWGILNSSGKVAVPFEYDYINLLYTTAVAAGGVPRGAIEAADNQAAIDNMSEANNQAAIDYIFNVDNQTAIDNMFEANNQVAIDDMFENEAETVTGTAIVVKGGKYGVIDTNHKVLIPLEYNALGQYFAELASVKKGDKWGVVDTKGKTVIPFEYDAVGSITTDVFCVKKGEKWGIVDKANKAVVSIEYEDIGGFRTATVNSATTLTSACVKKGGKWGSVNKDGKVIVPFEYNSSFYFNSDGFANVSKGGTVNQGYLTGEKYGVINESGKVILPIEYDQSIYLYDGLGSIRKGSKRNENGYIDYGTGKFGFVNSSYEIVFQALYDDTLITGREGDTAYVWLKRDGKWAVHSVNAPLPKPKPPIYVGSPNACNECDVCKSGKAPIKGCIRGTEEPEIFDFIEILLYLVKMPDCIIVACGNAFDAAILSEEGKAAEEPTIFCGLEVLQYLVGLVDGKDW